MICLASGVFCEYVCCHNFTSPITDHSYLIRTCWGRALMRYFVVLTCWGRALMRYFVVLTCWGRALMRYCANFCSWSLWSLERDSETGALSSTVVACKQLTSGQSTGPHFKQCVWLSLMWTQASVGFFEWLVLVN